jgi:HlyD family secretion protein
VWSGENVLTVPKSAVFRQRDRWAVYALEEGQAKLRLIESVTADA